MLKPIGDHILVKPLEREETTKSGIVIPETAKEKPMQGTVIALGDGKYMDDELVSFAKLGINTGDTVVFKTYSPESLKIDDVEYFILESRDILGIMVADKPAKSDK